MELKPDPGTARQAAQANHNKPRVGFTHNCYTTKLGRLFQETVKGGLERAIGVAWPMLVRYRTNGDKDAYRDGLRDPTTVFKYDDELFTILDTTLKTGVKEYLTDNDSKRKQTVVCQAFDLLLTLAFEDIYYRVLMKKLIPDLIVALMARPELFELDADEARIDSVFNFFEKENTDRKARYARFIEYVTAGKMEARNE